MEQGRVVAGRAHWDTGGDRIGSAGGADLLTLFSGPVLWHKSTQISNSKVAATTSAKWSPFLVLLHHPGGGMNKSRQSILTPENQRE